MTEGDAVQIKRTLPGKALWPSRSILIYGLRTIMAVCLALYVAYYLELTNPASAATIVLIVADPAYGLVLSKSVWRFIATLVGGFGSLLLIAAFAQTPELFILGLATVPRGDKTRIYGSCYVRS